MTNGLRFLLMAATTVVLAVAVPAVSADNLPQTSVWHRLDMDRANPAPEHERLSCSRGLVWTCHYDKAPEPALAFWWDTMNGDFARSRRSATARPSRRAPRRGTRPPA